MDSALRLERNHFVNCSGHRGEMEGGKSQEGGLGLEPSLLMAPEDKVEYLLSSPVQGPPLRCLDYSSYLSPRH